LLVLEDNNIIDHGKYFVTVIGEVKASERGLQWMCENSECTICQRDEMTVKKEIERLHTVLLFLPTSYSYHSVM
jgi:hypothetical protein